MSNVRHNLHRCMLSPLHGRLLPHQICIMNRFQNNPDLRIQAVTRFFGFPETILVYLILVQTLKVVW